VYKYVDRDINRYTHTHIFTYIHISSMHVDIRAMTFGEICPCINLAQTLMPSYVAKYATPCPPCVCVCVCVREREHVCVCARERDPIRHVRNIHTHINAHTHKYIHKHRHTQRDTDTHTHTHTHTSHITHRHTQTSPSCLPLTSLLGSTGSITKCWSFSCSVPCMFVPQQKARSRLT
jgi:hypothetical protein